MTRLPIRELTPADMRGVADLEARLLGQDPAARRTFWARCGDHYLNHDPDLCLAAEAEPGAGLAGFVIGELADWEYGQEEPVGWVKVVGVDPEFQGQGVGQALAETLRARFAARGVRRLMTLVEWDSGDLISFFKTLGFSRSPMIVLEQELTKAGSDEGAE